MPKLGELELAILEYLWEFQKRMCWRRTGLSASGGVLRLIPSAQPWSVFIEKVWQGVRRCPMLIAIELQ